MSDLTIFGASARAAASSARRAGLVPWTADLFADSDLLAMVPGAVRCPVGQYPHGLLDILRDSPPGPWMYTGGLENHPNLIREMADVRPLWGNGPNALIACRSPLNLQRILREESLPSPEVRAADAELPGYCSWLRKPLAGSAGLGIAVAEMGRRGDRQAAATAEPAGVVASTLRSPTHFYQQFVSGTPMSAVYVRARGDLRLLGVTEQLIGAAWMNAPPFRYAGNVGPVEPSAEVRHDLLRIGLVLGEQCDLFGLFGVDFVLHEGRPWVIEVNPRYPASVEVLELATGLPALALHRLAFDPEASPGTCRPAGGPIVGKGVLYAPQRLIVPPNLGPWAAAMESRSARVGESTGIQFADIPAIGEVIEAGWPILTLLSAGATRDHCLTELQMWVGRVERVLFEGRRPPTMELAWYSRLDDPNAD